MALGILSWDLTTFIKIKVWGKTPVALYPWTYIFYRPIEGNLLNYLVVCLVLGACGLFVYGSKNWIRIERLKGSLQRRSNWWILLPAFLSLYILGSLFIKVSPLETRILKSLIILFLLPIFLFLAEEKVFQFNKAQKGSVIVMMTMFGIISMEPIQLIRGPVYLMNEYIDIFGETYLEGTKTSNQYFLENLDQRDIDTIKYFYDLKNKMESVKTNALMNEDVEFLHSFKFLNLSFSQQYIEEMDNALDLAEFISLKGEDVSTKDFLDNLKRIDVEKFKQFYLKNFLETIHQTMGRGQLNHIGHILNPLNEYELGKPIRDIYFQYGIGYTFLSKWVMDVFGGISIENYYKTYIFYLIYFLFFLFMSLLIFSDRKYSLAAFAILPICFYFSGYLAFILAPGIIPSIHLLDVPVLILLYYFFSRHNFYCGLMAALLTAVSIVINRNFGIVMSVSFLVSLFLYALENKEGKAKILWLLGTSLGGFIMGLIFWISDVGTGRNIFPYYLKGFYSWPAKPMIIWGTFVYLIGSYFFIFLLKEKKFFLKYLYIFVFLYAQGSLAYYFWSGLTNHLPPVFAFVWIQVLLTFYIIENFLVFNNRFLHILHSWSTKIILVGLGVLILSVGMKFYSEKELFRENFKDHSTFQWKFYRGKLISTINPQIIQESINLIQKYSRGPKPQIYVISRYDGLLPLLAQRYSAMPYFEMISFIYSDRERDEAIRRIETHKPEYLFADRKIQDPQRDLWSLLYRASFFQKERASNFGRYEILKQIFSRVSRDYEKIEEGELISVYRRKPS
jgi:hypothetical protein